jgi:PAS domain S-box-containing protein
MHSLAYVRGLRYGITVLFALVLSAMAVIALAGYSSLESLLRNNQRSSHIQDIIDHLHSLRILLNEAEAREHDYLIRDDPHDLERFRSASAQARRQLHLLEALIGDQALQRRRLQSLEPLIEARFSTLNDSIQVRTQMGSEAALEMLRSSDGHPSADQVLPRIDGLISDEHSLLAERQPEESFPIGRAIRTIAGASVAGFLILSLTGVCTFRGLTVLRKRVAELSQRDRDLQARARFMDAVLESMDEGVVLLDSDMKVFRSNAAAEQLLKRGRSRLLGELTAQLEPGLTEGPLPFRSQGLQIAAHGAAGLLHTKLDTRSPDDPTLTSITASGTTLRDETGRLDGAVLLFRDISEQASMKSRLETNEAVLISLFHCGLEAAFIATQEDSLCIGANDGFLKLCGYSRDEILGWPIEKVSVIDNPGELRQAVEQARLGQIVRAPVGFRAKSGRVFDAVLSVLPIEIDGIACLLFILRSVEWRIQPSRLVRDLFGTLGRLVS